MKLQTSGREDESSKGAGGVEKRQAEQEGLPHHILAALGGRANIVHLDACITRLRAEVKEKADVDKNRLIALGALGVFEVGNNIQAIFGTRSDTIKTQIGDIMSGKTPAISPAPATEKPAVVEQQAAQKGIAIIEEDIVMPASGELMDITKVPDPVFSEKMTGDGFAVLPQEGTICSPVNGKVFNMFPSKHAIGILSDGGKEVLVHIGVNTVKLRGQGFKVLVQEGDLVAAGQPIMEVDIAYVKENAKSLISPIVFSNLPKGAAVELNKAGSLQAGEGNIVTIVKG